MTEGRQLNNADSLEQDSPNIASLRAEVGSASLRMRVQVTPRGLVALTGFVTCTLLSTAAIVAVATRKLRREPCPPA